jgi:protein-tyrosine phosphatase
MWNTSHRSDQLRCRHSRVDAGPPSALAVTEQSHSWQDQGPNLAAAFADIHCHLTPGIDDGARSWDETLAMARMAVEDGISTIIATPHQCGAFAQNTGEIIRSRVEEVHRFLDEQRVDLRVLPGADVRIEPGLITKLRTGEVLTLGDHGRHVLLELPHELYFPLEKLIEELRAAGMVGILSHPERNEGILARPAVLRPLVEAGCLMQITAGSLAGAFGPHVQKFSDELVEQRLVHFVSTDAHGPKSRRPVMRPAFERLARLAGAELAEMVCCYNPAQVAAGLEVSLRMSAPKARAAGGWLSWRKAG